MYTLLTMQYIAHLLADYTFQPQLWCKIKDGKLFSKEHLFHACMVFVCSWLLSFQVSFWWAALLIAVVHLLMDALKSLLTRKKILSRYLYFIDQLLHFAIITIVVLLFAKYTIINPLVYIPLQIAVLLFFVIFCTKPSNVTIRKYMKASDIIHDSEESPSLLKAGRTIGSLERLISFVLILFNQFAAVGFIIAAKSILRFRDTQTAKTEYVLIGTLLSFGIAIILGIAYRSLFGGL
jgi:Protein of unknown function (DUF3307).